MTISKALIKIRGSRTLLNHCFTNDSIPLERKEKKGVAGNNPEEWKMTYKATEEGKIYLDPSYIFGTLRGGAKYTKQGIRSLQSPLTSTLQILDEKIVLDRFVPNEEEITFDENNLVYIDVRSVRNPNSKGRNIRYRLAISKGWKAEFTIIWENTLISDNQMKAICRDAGTLVGLGDGRSIGFGRFEILDFKILKDQKSA